MNKQEIFDTVYAHLLKQGRKSRRELPLSGSGCAYRGEDGTKCAVGFLIPDDRYDPGFEGKNAAALPPEAFPFQLTTETCGLLSDLQNVHDERHPSTWAEDLAAVAAKHGLTVPST